MTNLLSQLDAASPADVPALCLRIADELGGEAEAEGWRALGVLGKRPQYHKNFTTWSWASQHPQRNMGHDLSFGWLGAVHRIHSPASFFTQSAALRTAARAFAGLPEEVKREILGTADATF